MFVLQVSGCWPLISKLPAVRDQTSCYTATFVAIAVLIFLSRSPFVMLSIMLYYYLRHGMKSEVDRSINKWMKYWKMTQFTLTLFFRTIERLVSEIATTSSSKIKKQWRLTFFRQEKSSMNNKNPHCYHVHIDKCKYVLELPQVGYHKQQAWFDYHDSNLKEVHIPASAEVASERYKILSLRHQFCHQILFLWWEY